MSISPSSAGLNLSRKQSGVTLLELITFIVVVSIALSGLLYAYQQAMSNSVDPIVKILALQRAQATMDQILTRKFDENTPSGGEPACDSSTGVQCAGIIADSDYDDVGDFNGYIDQSDADYPLSVTVTAAGDELGLPVSQARRITVEVQLPGGNSIALASYKVNY